MTQTVGWKCSLWLILLVAFVVRLALAFGVQQVVSQTPGRLCLIPGDADGYWELAGKLAAGKEYSIFEPPRRAMRMPGFPLLLALPRYLFGPSLLLARLFLVLIGTLACGLTYWLGRELSGPNVGLVAALYTALSPGMAVFSVLFLSETAFAAAMLASLIAAARLMRVERDLSTPEIPKRSIGIAIVTGMLIGLATYMRPTWILVGPGLAVLLVQFSKRPMRSRWVIAGCLVAGLVLTLVPWTIRNASPRVSGHLVPTTLWVGPSLYDGLNPEAKGDSDMTFFETDQLPQKMSEYDVDQEYRRRAWDFVAKNPGRTIWLGMVKQARYWSPIPNAEQFSNVGSQIAGWLAFLPLILLGLVGIWFSRRDPWLLILTLAPVLYFAAIHFLFVGSLRYRLPAEYPLSVLSAVGLCQLLQLRNQQTNGHIDEVRN